MQATAFAGGVDDGEVARPAVLGRRRPAVVRGGERAGGVDVRRQAGGVVGRGEPADRQRGTGGVGGVGVAEERRPVREGVLQRLDEDVPAGGGVQIDRPVRRLERGQDVQRLDQRHPARGRRRHGDQFVPAEAPPQRLHEARFVGGEVGGGQHAPGVLNRGDEGVRGVAGVEGGGAFGGDPRQQRGLRRGADLSRGRQGAAVQVGVPEGGEAIWKGRVGLERGDPFGPLRAVVGVERDAPLRQSDGGFADGRPRQRTPLRMSGVQAGDGAGDGDGFAAAAGGVGVAGEHVAGRGGGGAFAVVEGVGRAVPRVPEDEEPAAADPAGVRPHDRQAQARRHRRVDRVPAGPQDFGPGPCGGGVIGGDGGAGERAAGGRRRRPGLNREGGEQQGGGRHRGFRSSGAALESGAIIPRSVIRCSFPSLLPPVFPHAKPHAWRPARRRAGW